MRGVARFSIRRILQCHLCAWKVRCGHSVLVAILLGVTPLSCQCSAAQDKQPGIEAYLSRGARLMQSHLYDAAAAEFKQALALDSADPRARLNYALCLMSLGRDDEARRQFEQVHAQPLARYIAYYLARLDLSANDYASAIRRLEPLAGNPPFPDTDFFLGVAYVSAGQIAEGIKWLERAAQAMPRDYRVHYRLARAYSSAGHAEQAAREYSLYAQLRDEHKTTEKDVRACSEALRNSAPDSAREVCHRMYDPNDPEKLTLLGQLFGDAGAYQAALDPLQRAVQLDPGSFEAWHNLGLTYFRLQRYRDARGPLEKAVALRPEYFGSVVLLGATLYMLGDDAAALPVLERAHRLNPGDSQTEAVLERLRTEQQKKR